MNKAAKKQNDKPVVYIDGENFMYGAANILVKKGLIRDRKDIDYVDFRYIIERIIPEEDVSVRYYGIKKAGIIRRTPDLERKTTAIGVRQRKLQSLLHNQGIEYIGTGRLKLRDGDECKNCRTQEMHLQEKGVDVGLAVDMAAHAGRVKLMYLVSSDSDLLPAITMARGKKCHVVYVGFSNHLTNSLTHNTDSIIVIRDEEVVEAYNRLRQPKPSI